VIGMVSVVVSGCGSCCVNCLVSGLVSRSSFRVVSMERVKLYEWVSYGLIMSRMMIVVDRVGSVVCCWVVLNVSSFRVFIIVVCSIDGLGCVRMMNFMSRLVVMISWICRSSFIDCSVVSVRMYMRVVLVLFIVDRCVRLVVCSASSRSGGCSDVLFIIRFGSSFCLFGFSFVVVFCRLECSWFVM